MTVDRKMRDHFLVGKLVSLCTLDDPIQDEGVAIRLTGSTQGVAYPNQKHVSVISQVCAEGKINLAVTSLIKLTSMHQQMFNKCITMMSI